ncbi:MULTISPECIES: hypothetical protein [unclassified Micromonospora]|uniref:hypothetical protein n=1 Tax=unclassified Micromonospora TaxID=2617518 RepID=UPI0010330E0E|nr:MULTISPECIES: hypothetical protein [unclassified Micromonospora]QKW15556.1 hypothetical protein HUT12_24145 [Verrucosispora sp. NA02020]TBL38187.1 hypothetical protein EYA84_09960 [Verrucosispora sp. SN26_14.1]
MGENAWRRTDAWIFVSLVIASGAGRHRRSPTTRRPEGVRLADVISTADHLDRTLPERHDIEGAIRRLLGAGLVEVADGWFRITADGERLWRTRPSAGLATTVDTVQGVLSRRHPPGTADWHLDEAEHTAAVQEYLVRSVPMPRRSPEGHSGRG